MQTKLNNSLKNNVPVDYFEESNQILKKRINFNNKIKANRLLISLVKI
ncbi:hypothetical protein GCM10010832_10680 [Psychroflexus planctonicus]|uniref:Transposase n=1 Tax=Psychroflexus planctonicus TaxID=1526575 RepID=A0ABQ1SG46_9FLAO|nr:hypothetical protein GCM10010832_10680 [Psychroflexus planctonicus]